MTDILSETAPRPARYAWHGGSQVRQRELRADIQGLRALAVISVVLFHIWPQALPGGYVGVDVFFVISGYLITGMLFRELQDTGRISLLKFYERRMKRLLPAASLVLIVVALATPLLPPARWEETSIGILASALYVENWHLAWLAVDYLGAENSPSPVQHYWSLSIEEQFYILWPLIMIAAAAVSFLSANLRMRLMIPLAALTFASLAASIWLTQVSPASAYFVTHTRLWELGLGALLAIAVLPDFPARMRETMRVVGLVAILISVFSYSGETAFPGYAALLPTLGCALVIAAGTDAGRWTAYRLLALSPAQYLGNISYSFYLWHWPLIVFAGLYAPGGFSIVHGLALFLASVVLADLTKRFVEDPVRYWQTGSIKAFAFGIASIGCCILSATVIYKYVAMQVIESYGDSPDYPGARAFLENAAVPRVGSPIPPLTLLKRDRSQAYKKDCHLNFEDTELYPCVFGPETGKRVTLIGDSHAASWIPALAVLADRMDWRIETHTKSACALYRKPALRRDQPYPECKEWGGKLLAELRRSRPDIVILTQQRFGRVADEDGKPPHEQTAAAIVEVWREIQEAGAKVIAIRDTPALPFKPDECLLRDIGCYADQSQVLKDFDPIVIAHGLAPDVPMIDMTDAVCKDQKCPMIIGNIVVWRDSHHLTASYVRSVASAFGERIISAVGRYDVRKEDHSLAE